MADDGYTKAAMAVKPANGSLLEMVGSEVRNVAAGGCIYISEYACMRECVLVLVLVSCSGRAAAVFSTHHPIW